jgi:hypothetical protein
MGKLICLLLPLSVVKELTQRGKVYDQIKLFAPQLIKHAGHARPLQASARGIDRHQRVQVRIASHNTGRASIGQGNNPRRGKTLAQRVDGRGRHKGITQGAQERDENLAGFAGQVRRVAAHIAHIQHMLVWLQRRNTCQSTWNTIHKNPYLALRKISVGRAWAPDYQACQVWIDHFGMLLGSSDSSSGS